MSPRISLRYSRPFTAAAAYGRIEMNVFGESQLVVPSRGELGVPLWRR